MANSTIFNGSGEPEGTDLEAHMFFMTLSAATCNHLTLVFQHRHNIYMPALEAQDEHLVEIEV